MGKSGGASRSVAERKSRAVTPSRATDVTRQATGQRPAITLPNGKREEYPGRGERVMVTHDEGRHTVGAGTVVAVHQGGMFDRGPLKDPATRHVPILLYTIELDDGRRIGASSLDVEPLREVTSHPTSRGQRALPAPAPRIVESTATTPRTSGKTRSAPRPFPGRIAGLSEEEKLKTFRAFKGRQAEVIFNPVQPSEGGYGLTGKITSVTRLNGQWWVTITPKIGMAHMGPLRVFNQLNAPPKTPRGARAKKAG